MLPVEAKMLRHCDYMCAPLPCMPARMHETVCIHHVASGSRCPAQFACLGEAVVEVVSNIPN